MEKDEKTSAAAEKNAAPAPKEKKNKKSYLSEISSMTMDSLIDYSIRMVLIPYAKKAVIEILTKYLDTKSSPQPDSSSKKESYSEYYVDKTSTEVSKNSYTRSVYSYDTVIFDNYNKAESILNTMKETMKLYNRVKVADFYELAGMDVTPNDHSYGWLSLDGVDIARGKGQNGLGFQIMLPRAVYLK